MLVFVVVSRVDGPVFRFLRSQQTAEFTRNHTPSLQSYIYIYRDEYVYTHMNTHIQIYRYVDSYILKA